MNIRIKSLPGASAAFQRATLVLMSLNTLYQYMYCMTISSAFSLTPVLGGALFMSAQISVQLVHMLQEDTTKKQTRRMRTISFVLLSFMLLCSFVLLAVYPFFLNMDTMWILFSVVLLLTLRAEFSKRLLARYARGGIKKNAFLILLSLLHVFSVGAASVLFFSTDFSVGALQMLGGLLLASPLECYSLWREHKLRVEAGETPPVAAEAILHTAEGLREISAYQSFERFHVLILMALQVTLVLVYTFIGFTFMELFTRLAFSVGVTLLMREGTSVLLRRLKNKIPTATHLLLFGLAVWITGLVMFYRQMGQTVDLIMGYLNLGLSISGMTICITCLAELELQMTSVAQFGLENALTGYSQIRTGMTEIAILTGQMLALVLLTLLCAPTHLSEGSVDVAVLIQNFRPLMIIPPLLLLIAAAVGVLHFPLNHRYFLKIRRFLTLTEEGEDNASLKKQLDRVVVKRHKNRFGIRIIISLLRPLYYHKVIGTENTTPYEEGTMIFVCNHGELYGPIVANLYIPISFRPWVISSMMSREALVKHVYEGTMVRQKWLPERWKMPLLRLISPIFTWLFESLDSIPVYRGDSHKLIRTFRMTIEAMDAGDNILLFPENGEDQDDSGRGYLAEGVGKLYTGFAMLAPTYYRKTKKAAVFIPVYASKRLRTLTIGKGIPYNPSASLADESVRIVGELQQAMQDMFQKEMGE